ncbi:MAG: hypothetical protein A2Z34_05190, partial [Planctomycetes bacterium RBG_16_59_8]
KEVVVDTDSPYTYVGRLTAANDRLLQLKNADVRDRRDSTTTVDRYLIEVKKSGVRPNRRNVAVRTPMVVDISLLEDVIEY